MKLIAIANHKGGCGKTTTTINLAACLSTKNRRVLVVDFDPQGHSSLGLSCLPESIHVDPTDILLSRKGESPLLEQSVIPIREHLHLIPATVGLATFEPRLTGIERREYRLKEHLRSLTIHYDYIIIDCPPSLGLLTFNALMAAGEVIIPIDSSLYSLHGVNRLLETIEVIRKHSGHTVIAKALAVCVDRRTRFALELIEDIRKYFGPNIFKTIIHSTVRLREAASFGKSIDDYLPRSTGARDYMALSQELIDTEKLMEELADSYDEDFYAMATEHPIGDMRIFEYDYPEAGEVAIVGEFNQWNPEMGKMARQQENGKWLRRMYLPPGPHEYKLVVDGKWILDPKNDQVARTGLGTENSLLIIEDREHSD